jgi:hypothetical protein
LQDGTLSAAEGEAIFLQLGWPPGLARQVAEHYGAAKAVTVSPEVKSEQTRLRTTAHSSYVKREVGRTEATTALTAAGVDAADIDPILTLWDAERALIRAQLSPADIRKAYQQADVNAATGQPWTHDDAIAALLDRGWAMTDAESYLMIHGR